ncbi:uncharacterized protein DUF1835 [Pseudomonas duriflava]|uniref:Uncharacterized protein DUF1835 n=1 Tax=Pseudomonas duriflava TaxID=459528 RepID=A0A562QLH2_9PSED|nr:DUF1835 domain-containing protein [Pseudomonas duriflava]TWI57574.1 uncharacterized protein DUF1835 [Pseudomonas duriflava]
MWHITCGDVAADSVRQVLGDEIAAALLRVMHDDMAVGPLQDVDQPPCSIRAAFWTSVWPADIPVADFSGELSIEADWLKYLAKADRPVTVWHGDSASEQLLLCRIAATLEHSSVELYDVPCGTGISATNQRRAVGMCSPEQLRTFYTPHLVDAKRQRALAEQWHKAVRENAQVRRWREGAFHGEAFAMVDSVLTSQCPSEWGPLARVMAETMVRTEGFFASDFFLFWRARELAAQGVLELEGPADASYMHYRVRLLPT